MYEVFSYAPLDLPLFAVVFPLAVGNVRLCTVLEKIAFPRPPLLLEPFFDFQAPQALNPKT